LISQILQDHHARVFTASNAEAARQLLETERPNIILSDIGMPNQDGYEFIAEIRRSGNKIPALALTAFARSEDRIRALQAGFQMHIAKPFEPQELLASIAALLGQGSKTGSRTGAWPS
jgi:DNA-binding response OmpR family regulator